ncbi:MAG: asparagine synthetase B [Spirochaetes bacterium GWF1_51_8]|nr:MAG: asparagine synthetase B [Spirochaetes bacterium GWF1_51_8]
MDDTQANHLKAYGMAYLALQKGIQVKWLLNYRGGSFLIMQDDNDIAEWAMLRNISYKFVTENDFAAVKAVIDQGNMNIVDLEKAPIVAVYAPPWNAPWDDAVTLVLEFAEIPYTRIWDQEVIGGLLTPENYDWLHLHHEDFTGQFGKFWFSFASEKWYIEQVSTFQKIANTLGFANVQDEKKAVAVKIRQYVLDGGFLFAMCSAADTLDIALSALDFDMVPAQIDGTPFDSLWPNKIDYSGTLAFENFNILTEPYLYEHSDIDIDQMGENIYSVPFYFRLKDFAAKYDVIPTMLVQNHKNLIKGFLGQATGFQKSKLKKDITILADIENKTWVNYIHGDRGKGTFTYYAGHDPEDYAHQVGDPPTNLDLFPNSPGYRLILNNILFPAAKTKKKKT